MIVKIDKSFDKDVKKLKVVNVKQKILLVINEIQNAEKLSDIRNLKKLTGTNNFYRIRLGEYRIGLVINNEEVELIRFLHRKEVYRYFP